MKMEIQRLQCKRCGHEWVPRQEQVRICPKCKSAYWDKERINGKAKRIGLTQERVRELFDYREDGELVWKNRQDGRNGAVAGCVNANGYLQTNISGRIYYNHRIIFLYHYGFMPENSIDHIDRDKLNNRITNLREISKQCNARNSAVRVNSVSGVTGVDLVRGRWRVAPTINNVSHYIGHFLDLTEAVAHRLAAEQCLGWEGCHSGTSAYLYIQKYLEGK